ncbi:MAG: outer membrane protein transport protein [Cytophagales bacterium]|nr:outer membrane protein transport protein [Cytophagales bacterium]
MKKLLTVSLFLTFSNYAGYASGYQVLLQGNRTTGMGNLGVMMSKDASSLFFNPGAMGFMDHNSVMAGFNPIFASNSYWNSETPNSTYTANSDNPMGTPFHVYAVWGPAENNFKFGIGAFTPFGSRVNWGNTWTGRDLLNELSLRSIQIQPTISYKISDKFSLGAGLDITIGSVELTRTILLDGRSSSDGHGEGSVTLEGNATTAFGFNIGVLYRPTDKLDVGLSYRSEVTMKLEDGTADFVVPSSLAPLFPSGNTFNAQLPLPSVTTVGLSYRINENLEIGTQFDWVGWSAYKSLDFDFKQNTPLLEDTSSPRNYDDSWVLHLGGEYAFETGLQLRAGVYYDKTPVQDGYMTAETPDNNRIGLTAGLGYGFGDLQLDLSFLYIHSTEREQTQTQAEAAGTYDSETGSRDVLPGTYRLNALIPGISIAYKF